MNPVPRAPQNARKRKRDTLLSTRTMTQTAAATPTIKTLRARWRRATAELRAIDARAAARQAQAEAAGTSSARGVRSAHWWTLCAGYGASAGCKVNARL
jgi:hypothetical protein